MSRRDFLRNAAEFTGYCGIVTLISWLPLRLGLAVGRGLAALTYVLDRPHRRTTLENLRMALNLPDAEARALARRIYRHFGEVFVEATHLWYRMSGANMSRFVKVIGIEHVEAAKREGRGILFVTAHYGNWEMGGLAIGWLCGGLVGVKPEGRNPLIEKWVTGFRARGGIRMIPRAGAMREMMRTLRRGGVVGILTDQDAHDYGIIVPFFGIPASTVPTAAWLAMSTGAPVIFGFARRAGVMQYEVHCLPPFHVGGAGDREQTVKAVTEQLNLALEKVIRAEPDQWMWPHRRWKSGLKAQAALLSGRKQSPAPPRAA